MVNTIVISVCIALPSFVIVAILIVFLNKKIKRKYGCCCSAGGGVAPTDTERLDGSYPAFVEDDTGNSGYVGGESTTSFISERRPTSTSVLPISPLDEPSSTSIGNCSIVSIDETKRLKLVSREVQTEPVTIISAAESEFCDVALSEPAFTTEHDFLDDNEFANSQTEANNGNQVNQTALHFETFSQFADYIIQERQTCSSGPNIGITEDNNLSAAPFSFEETICSSSTAIPSPQPSSSTKRKWEEEDNNCINRDYMRLPNTKDDNVSVSGELNTTRDKSKEHFVSATQTKLKRQQKHFGGLIDKGHIKNAPRLQEVDNALQWLQKLHEILLGEGGDLSENATLNKFEFHQCISFLQDLQKSSLVKADKLISLAQKLLLFQLPFLKNTTSSSEETDSTLVMGVDATPRQFGGYCVNLKERWIQFYIVDVADVPWKMLHKNHSDEFEMKNFILALCIWHREIEKHKKISIYTDNNAISMKNGYGCMVNRLIKHFVACKDAQLCNNSGNMHVNRIKKLALFAKYIQPADDLSRGQINKCIEFLCKFYAIGMENVSGTHQIQVKWDFKVRSGRYAFKTSFYNQALATARSFIYSLECQKCFGIANQPCLIFSDLKNANSTHGSFPFTFFSLDVDVDLGRGKRRRRRKHK